MKTNREEIAKIVEENLFVDSFKIVDEADLMTDLGADSLDVVQIVIDIEKLYDIIIGDDDAITLRTFGDLVTYIDNRCP